MNAGPALSTGGRAADSIDPNTWTGRSSSGRIGLQVSTRIEGARTIIRESERKAFAWGFIPLPLVDAAAVTVVQLRMIRRLARHYGVPYREREVRPILTALLGSLLPTRFGASVARSLFRGVPGVGPLLGVVTMPASLGGATRVIGKLFAQHFENGGSVANFNLQVRGGKTPDTADANAEEATDDDVVAQDAVAQDAVIDPHPAVEVDDLTKLEGIGPKINELLQGAGIRTYQQLAETPVETLSRVLETAGPRFRLHNPESWPRQARLAADGRWDELDELNA